MGKGRRVYAPTVYTVAWDDDGILKVGFSSHRRWRAFEKLGGRVVRLEECATAVEGYYYEAGLHACFADLFPRAFRNRAAAVPYLGGDGAGWAECYEVPGRILVHMGRCTEPTCAVPLKHCDAWH